MPVGINSVEHAPVSMRCLDRRYERRFDRLMVKPTENNQTLSSERFYFFANEFGINELDLYSTHTADYLTGVGNYH